MKNCKPNHMIKRFNHSFWFADRLPVMNFEYTCTHNIFMCTHGKIFVKAQVSKLDMCPRTWIWIRLIYLSLCVCALLFDWQTAGYAMMFLVILWLASYPDFPFFCTYSLVMLIDQAEMWKWTFKCNPTKFNIPSFLLWTSVFVLLCSLSFWLYNFCTLYSF